MTTDSEIIPNGEGLKDKPKIGNSLRGESDPLLDLQKTVSEIKEQVSKQRNELKENIDKQKGEIKDVNQTMKYVVLVLLVMVGAMILSLQIAIFQTKQDSPRDINLRFEPIKNE